MKIRVDFSKDDSITMIGEIGHGKTVKKFTAKARVLTTKKEAIEECYNLLMAKKNMYFESL